MTSVRFGRAEDGLISFVDLQGHAGFAEEGEDIVCSAVTSAVQLTHALLENVRRLPFDTFVDPEGTHIRLDFPAHSRASAQDMLEALFIHYSELQEAYAEFIQVTEVHSHAEN